MLRRLPRSTLCPYTALFGAHVREVGESGACRAVAREERAGKDECSEVIRGVSAIDLRSRVRLRPFNPCYGATLSPFGFDTSGRLAKSGACRAVAREERARHSE